MTEVHRYKAVKMLSENGNRITYRPSGPDVVMAEAYDQLKAEIQSLRNTCARASACLDRWAAGHAFDPDGPGGQIRAELFDAYRPGVRTGLELLHELADQELGQ